MSMLAIRLATPGDRAAIRAVEEKPSAKRTRLIWSTPSLPMATPCSNSSPKRKA
jgi:hypothetical protein